ncbi:MAG: hypothetical protein N2749_02590 [Clostridia bacterium]|nr:hypothetical protein [Clostridia bacterium]
MKKNLFLTFCFSFIPGAGQMYQNYMKRGLSIMLVFAAFMAVSIILDVGIFAIPLPIIFAYSFFDTYNLRNKFDSDKENIEKDSYIWEGKDIKFINEFNINKKNKILGTILLLFGIYLLFNNVLLGLAYRFDIEILNTIITYISRYLPAIIISAISIVVGTKILVNK